VIGPGQTLFIVVISKAYIFVSTPAPKLTTKDTHTHLVNTQQCPIHSTQNGVIRSATVGRYATSLQIVKQLQMKVIRVLFRLLIKMFSHAILGNLYRHNLSILLFLSIPLSSSSIYIKYLMSNVITPQLIGTSDQLEYWLQFPAPTCPHY